jgi:hypothetical protein
VVYASTTLPGYKNPLDIGFTSPVSFFSALVLNGEVVTVSYTAKDSNGNTDTHTLVEDFNNGAGTFTLNDTGILNVSIGTPGAFWDYSIDNVRFTPGVPAPEPASLALLATGVLGLAGYGWRRHRPAA